MHSAQLLDSSFIDKNPKFYGDENFLYLFTDKSNFKSSDGFNFKSFIPKPQLVRQLVKKDQNLKTKIDKYAKYISDRLEKNLNSLLIESIFSFKNGDLVVYHLKSIDDTFRVNAFLLDKKQPGKFKWYSEEAIWESPKEWVGKNIVFIKLLQFNNSYFSYWLVDNLLLVGVSYPVFKLGQKIRLAKLAKVAHNPIISPQQENSWESFNTFNPAALYEAGKVHILYRAQGYDYYSSVGYATSKDGFFIDERLNQPVFSPREDFEMNKAGMVNKNYWSGGGWGGCEDPRVTKIGDRVYMTYVAFDGCTPPRLALTSISLKDFLARNWLWEKPVLISPPGVVDKSGCLLPEKINGKYVIFHRIFPNILIDFVDDLIFDSNRFLKGEYKIGPRSRKFWDSRKIGAGAPPVKTKDGWLLIYQGVDDKDDSCYKIGAMLLALDDPTKILYRCQEPILQPDKNYEQQGFKAGVVYPCGAVVIKNTLFVYYGTADSYVSVATADLNQFLQDLKNNLSGKIQPVEIKY